ncbi:MAG: ribosomal RNA small subunit methyltransferase A [Clostridiales bacterium]|nr:ribosomal RNA small subunit methyltransferase A [Clostridiales bacterium]
MEKVNYKKQFGQNFIYDTNLLKAIVEDAMVTNDDEVLEIGVGVGSLTKEICKKAKKVVSYEIDKSLEKHIKENLKEFNNHTLIFNDILEVDNAEIKTHFNKNFKIVANLPYYITTPIIFKFLEGNFNLESLTIMVQKEVGERICSKENSKDYGILSVMLQTYANCKVVRQINRKMFTPSPNVDSCLVKIDLDFNKYNITNKEKYREFIKQCFSMRRKTLVNNLKSYVEKEKLIKALNKLTLNENIRSEQISIEKLVELFNILGA